MESCCDYIYVGNESKNVSGRITGLGYDYHDENNSYKNWTDLNGNTLAIVVWSDHSDPSRGFELEFRCRDQSQIQIDCYDGNNGGCSHHCNQVSSLKIIAFD